MERGLWILIIAIILLSSVGFVSGVGPNPSCGSSDYMYCDGSCVYVAGSSAHCGSCTNVCNAMQYCSSGTCVPKCGNGRTDSGEQCDNGASNGAPCNANSCGSTCNYCDASCHIQTRQGPTCTNVCCQFTNSKGSVYFVLGTSSVQGSSMCSSYPSGTPLNMISPCNAGLGNTVSGQNIPYDIYYSKTCGSTGNCFPGCDPLSGDKLCGAACINSNSDTNNCGTCGNTCNADKPKCDGGTCVQCTVQYQAQYCTNIPPTGCADTTHIRTYTATCPDNANCAYPYTDTACSGTTPYCSGGVCKASCTNTNGVCVPAASVSYATSDTNYYCSYGGCFICNSGYTACNNACKNYQTDNNNCGACGNICTVGRICQSGTCTCPAGTYWTGTACVANSCSDSDGSNINVQGSTTGYLNGATYTNTDSCYYGGTTAVYEYSCSGTASTATQINCPASNICLNGVCNNPSCVYYNGWCNSGIANTAINNAYKCAGGTNCYMCTGTYTRCSNTCVNLTSDTNNCGQCNVKCNNANTAIGGPDYTGKPNCVNGVCVMTCNSAQCVNYNQATCNTCSSAGCSWDTANSHCCKSGEYWDGTMCKVKNPACSILYSYDMPTNQCCWNSYGYLHIEPLTDHISQY